MYFFFSQNGAEHQVWVSCQGEKPVDKENVGGFRYFPSQGFPSFYFPYKNVKNYLSPLVAVQVLNTARKFPSQKDNYVISDFICSFSHSLFVYLFQPT